MMIASDIPYKLHVVSLLVAVEVAALSVCCRHPISTASKEHPSALQYCCICVDFNLIETYRRHCS